MPVDGNIPILNRQSRSRKPYSLERDLIEERAAIMAEGNGWSQGKAERTIAWERGFGTWGELLGAVK